MNTDNLFELVLKDAEDEVFAVSFVAEPAIERDFVYMAKAKKEYKFEAIDEDKHLVAGPLLVPNKKIIRVDEVSGQPYYVYFTGDTINKIAHKYMEKKYNDAVTYEHTSPVDNVSLVESWVIEKPTADKSNIYNMTLPKGTWFGIFKVNNPELWEDIKQGTVKGFSIEGMFDHRQANLDLSVQQIEEMEAEYILSKMKAIIKDDKRTKSGKKLEKQYIEDYPSAMVMSAKKALRMNDRSGGKLLSSVAKIKASDLANKKPMSVETLRRMNSVLNKLSEENLSIDTNDTRYVSYLAYGGKAGLNWSKKKLEDMGLLKAEAAPAAQPSVVSSYPGEGPTKKNTKKNTVRPATLKPATIGNKKKK